jgi:hypothetical protein
MQESIKLSDFIPKWRVESERVDGHPKWLRCQTNQWLIDGDVAGQPDTRDHLPLPNVHPLPMAINPWAPVTAAVPFVVCARRGSESKSKEKALRPPIDETHSLRPFSTPSFPYILGVLSHRQIDV